MGTRKQRSRKWLMDALKIAGISYLILCLVLWRYQTQLIFFPDPILRNTPDNLGLNYEEVFLPVEDGQVHGWWMPTAQKPAAQKPTAENTSSQIAPTVLYLHGNGSNVGDLVYRASQLHQWGCNVLLIDYRGYGLSSGPFPNEKRVYADSEAAWQYLIQQRQISAESIVIYGHSLGGAIALNLAAQHPNVAGTITESTFASMTAMVKYQYPLLVVPTRWLLQNKFDSLKKVPSLQTPLLLIHGKRDRIVPAPMSQQLYEATPASTPKTLLWIEEGDHNNLPTVGAERYSAAIQTFIEKHT